MENQSSSNWWKIAKQLTGIKGDESSIPPLLVNDKLIFDDIGKANEFNRFFATQSVVNDTGILLPDLNPIDSEITNIQLTEHEVEDVLKTLNPSKSSGPDLISPRLLKASASVLKSPLCKLFNFSLLVISISTF